MERIFKGCKLLFVFVSLFAGLQNVYAEGEEAKAEAPVEQQQISIQDLVFSDSVELNSSIAVKKEHGRFYLIMEVDHNFNRNEFIITTEKLGISTDRLVQVAKENLSFGFHNKFVAYFPIIEVLKEKGGETRDYIFDLKTQEHRTQQHIDITETLESAARNSAVADSQGRVYNPSEIHELAFVLMADQEGKGKSLQTFKVDLRSLEEGEFRQFYGETRLTDIPIKAPSQPQAEALELSPEVIQRYLAPFIQEVENELLDVDRLAKIKSTLEAIPIEFEEGRLRRIADKLNHAETSEAMIEVLVREQLMLPPIKIPQVMCKNVFKLN